jgi:hypothetical protein
MISITIFCRSINILLVAWDTRVHSTVCHDTEDVWNCKSSLIFRKKWALLWNILHFHWLNEFKVIFNPICISVTGLLLVTRFTIGYLFMTTNIWFNNSTTWLTSGSATIKLVPFENRRDVNTVWILSGRSLIYKRKRSKPRTQLTHSPCLN